LPSSLLPGASLVDVGHSHNDSYWHGLLTVRNLWYCRAGRRKGILIMSVEENKQLVRRYWDEIWNKRNLAILGEYYEPEEAALYREYLQSWERAFPDLQSTVERLIAEGEQVVAVMTFQGTHTGELSQDLHEWLPKTLPPTGKQVEVQGIFVFQIANGKFKDEGYASVHDWLELLRQLGAISDDEQLACD
jgi:predicted ester cyclase